MGLDAIVVTEFTAGLFRLALGWSFGERRGLPLTRSLRRFEKLTQLLDLALELGNLAPKRLTSLAVLNVHPDSIAIDRRCSCAIWAELWPESVSRR